jgi:hypothetical protein
LSWDIVDAMSTVKELMLSPAGTAAEPLAGVDEADAAAGELAAGDDGLVALDVVDELQAAAARATTAAPIATDPGRR